MAEAMFNRCSDAPEFLSQYKFEPRETLAKLENHKRLFVEEDLVLSDEDMDMHELRTCPPSPVLLAEAVLKDWMRMEPEPQQYRRRTRSESAYSHRSLSLEQELANDPMKLGFTDFTSSAEHQFSTPPPGTPNIPELAMPDILDHVERFPTRETYPEMMAPTMNHRMRPSMPRRAPHPVPFQPEYPPYHPKPQNVSRFQYGEQPHAAQRQRRFVQGVPNMVAMPVHMGQATSPFKDYGMQRNISYKKQFTEKEAKRHKSRNYKRAPPCPPDDPMDPLPTVRTVRVCTPNPTAALYEAQRRRTDLFPVKPLFQVMANKQFKAGRRVKRNITVLCKMQVKDKVLYKQKSAQTKNAAKTAAAISMLEKLRNLNVHITYVASVNKKQAKAAGLLPEEPTPSESQMSQSSELSSSDSRSPTLQDAKEKARQKLNTGKILEASLSHVAKSKPLLLRYTLDLAKDQEPTSSVKSSDLE